MKDTLTMGYHYYNYQAYLETEKALGMPEIMQALQAFSLLQTDPSSLTLTFDGWKLWITLSEAEHIAEEAAELAEIYHYPDLNKCSTRLEIYAEDDPDELHYNDHLYVLEALSDVQGIHIFDPVSGEFPYAEPADDRPAPETDFLELVDHNDDIERLVDKLRKQPDNWEAWHDLGIEYNEAGRDDLAIRCYQNSIFLHEQNDAGHYNLGKNYLVQGAMEPAREHLLRANELNQNQGDYLTTLGELYAAEGDQEAALEYLFMAVDEDPGNEFSNANLGYYLLLYGEGEKALPYIEASIALGGIDVSGFNKAHLFLIQGEEQQAVEWYAASLTHYIEREDFWADFDADFELMPQYGITEEYYNSLKAKIEYFRFTNDISLN